MISECGKFLTDPEVAELFDAVNARGPQKGLGLVYGFRV